LKKGLIGLVVLLVGAFLIVMFYGSSIVKGSVEEYGPEYTGTSVQLADVSFSPLSGTAGLSGLVIGSPAGFEAEKTFSLDDISVAMETSTLFSDPVHIKELRITNPEIIVEFQGSKLNINALMDNIEKYAGSDSESTTNVVIDDLYITGAKVTVMGLPVGDEREELALPDIHLQDIGNKTGDEEGVSFSAATEETMAAVTAAVTTVLADARVQGFLEKGKNFVKDKLKGIFGGDDEEEEGGTP
jgi:uncharacterized protein involved in outer membrane biogenesis